MRYKITLLTLLLVSFFSCKKSEDPIVPKPIVEEPVADDKNPELTVSGFADIIETTTEVSIGIVDDSTVETKVMHNGVEIAVSTEKQFNVSINPYGVPVGPTDFIVTSKDAKGNETSETFSVEIKHLLMTYEFGAHEIDENQTWWLFFNNANGKQLAVIEGTIGIHKMYTDEIILEDRVFFSKVRNPSFGDTTFKNLYISTYEVPLAVERMPQVYYQPVESEHIVNAQLNDVPYEFNTPYIAIGPNYFSTSSNGDTSHTNMVIEHDASRPVYIRTKSWGSNPPFDGKKENYFYTKITPLVGNTTMELELEAFINAENNKKLEIPVHDAGSLNIFRRGYENNQDHANNKAHQFYDTSESSDTTFDYVDLPILSGLETYETSISYNRNGTSFFSLGDDTDLETEMPNWTADLEVNDTIVELTANNQEVNYYGINFFKKEETSNNSRFLMSWHYGVISDDSGKKQFPILSLPETISEAMAEPFYQTIDDLSWNSFSAVDYDKYDSYDEVVGGIVFNKNIMTALDNKSRHLSFGNPDLSGKSAKEFSDKINMEQQKNPMEYKWDRRYQSHFDEFLQY